MLPVFIPFLHNLIEDPGAQRDTHAAAHPDRASQRRLHARLRVSRQPLAARSLIDLSLPGLCGTEGKPSSSSHFQPFQIGRAHV